MSVYNSIAADVMFQQCFNGYDPYMTLVELWYSALVPIWRTFQYTPSTIFTVRHQSCGNVMFSIVSARQSVYPQGVPMCDHCQFWTSTPRPWPWSPSHIINWLIICSCTYFIVIVIKVLLSFRVFDNVALLGECQYASNIRVSVPSVYWEYDSVVVCFCDR